MFKKLIAGALASVVLSTTVVTGGIAVSALNYKPIVNDSQNYHNCGSGENCQHGKEIGYLGIQPMGNWGFVYNTSSSHKNNYKYLSITPYGYDAKSESYYVFTAYGARKGGTTPTVICDGAVINNLVVKTVYNGQIFRSGATSSGILKKYLVGAFRDGCPIL